MSQVKKAEVRQAILHSANSLFRENGFVATTMAKIARRADVGTSTIYVYFRSKVEIFFEVYIPWLEEQLTAMEVALVGIKAPRERLRLVMEWMWIRIPAQDNYFSNELIVTIATATPRDFYTTEPFTRIRSRLANALTNELSKECCARMPALDLALIILMAFDGFSIRVHLEAEPTTPQFVERLIDWFLCAQLD